MGKRRSVRRSLDDLVEQTEDQPLEGGCDRCDVYSTVEAISPGIYSMSVHHDDWCPFLRARNAETN
jgi:hypothetical protein